MTDFTPQEPSSHPLPAYAATLARQVLTAGVAWALGRGLIPADAVGELVAAGMICFSAFWGLYKQHTAAVALKDAIAAPAGLAKP